MFKRIKPLSKLDYTRRKRYFKLSRPLMRVFPSPTFPPPPPKIIKRAYYKSQEGIRCGMCHVVVKPCSDCSLHILAANGKGGCSPDAVHCSCDAQRIHRGNCTPAYRSSSPEPEDDSPRYYCVICNTPADYCNSSCPCASVPVSDCITE